MTWRILFLTFVVLLATQTFAGEVIDPNCEECRKSVNEPNSSVDPLRAIIAEIPPAKRIPDDTVELGGVCPSPAKTLTMGQDFNLKLRDEQYVVSVPQPKIKDAHGKIIIVPPKNELRHRCAFQFPNDCGIGKKTSAIEKLDWLKTNLRKMNPVVCEKVANDFGEKCGPWAGLDTAARKEKALGLVQLAVDSYEPGPSAELLPKYKVPVTKNKNLDAHLVQCVMHRENHNFEPNKLNYTECTTATSSANGLFQILESTANDFIKRNVLGNYCWQFHKYWEQVLPESRGPEYANADIYPKPKKCGDKDHKDLVKDMSDYPEFQAVVGVGMINYFLEMSEHDKNHRRWSEEDKVKYALDHYWFTTGNDQDSASVLNCRKCLDHGGTKCL